MASISRSDCLEKGFDKKLLQPEAKAFCLSSSKACAEIAITGI